MAHGGHFTLLPCGLLPSPAPLAAPTLASHLVVIHFACLPHGLPTCPPALLSAHLTYNCCCYCCCPDGCLSGWVTRWLVDSLTRWLVDWLGPRATTAWTSEFLSSSVWVWSLPIPPCLLLPLSLALSVSVSVWGYVLLPHIYFRARHLLIRSTCAALVPLPRPFLCLNLRSHNRHELIALPQKESQGDNEGGRQGKRAKWTACGCLPRQWEKQWAKCPL